MVNNRKKKRMSHETRVSTIIVIFELLLFMVPIAVLCYILVQATDGQKTPALGNRFVGDLNPSISNNAVNSIKNSLSTITDVENVEINLKTATLRITIDAKDNATKEELEVIVNKAYDIVAESLAIETYFTNTTSKRMYDLDIKAFNVNGRTDQSDIEWLCVEKIKNGTSEEAKINYVSEAIDQELADELRKELEEE